MDADEKQIKAQLSFFDCMIDPMYNDAKSLAEVTACNQISEIPR